MPAGVLNPPGAGFHGKLPTTGDFVSRGIPDLFRQRWDSWVTRHLAPRLNGAIWPEDGLRFRLVSGGRVAGGMILPGEDSAGRRFPLSILLIGDALPAPGGLDIWADGALQPALLALSGDLGVDEFYYALADLPVPGECGPDDTEMLLWTSDTSPEACDPSDPTPLLDRLIGDVSSG